MALIDDLKSQVATIFRDTWGTTSGRVVPAPSSVGLGNQAIEFDEAVVLYADLDGSTAMVDNKTWQFSAEIYKTYLHCAAKIIKSEDGVITAYDGDRIMAVFIGERMRSRAALAGLKLNSAVRNIINPAIKHQYPQSDFVLKHVVGIDVSSIRATRTGVRGEGQVISLIGDDLSSLYQSELKLTSIFGSIPLGLMVVNSQGTIQEVLSEYCHVLLNEHSLIGASLSDILLKHNPDMHTELNDAFGVLRDFEGHFTSEFATGEGTMGRLQQLQIEDGSHTGKWIKPRFQPIAKNNVIDRYMVILEDVTTSYLAQRQIERADILGKQAQALYECAIRDPLSGLYTRLFMNDSISRLIASAKRGNLLELSIVMFDLDNFKSINDTYGHDAGDQVIREFGRIIRTCTRDTDISVRYGGEEFVLALPCNDTHEQGGAIVAERIRAKLADTLIKLPNGKTVRVTTSCGVAYCHANDTLEGLLQRADQYLYTAKHNGKNRLQVESNEGE